MTNRKTTRRALVLSLLSLLLCCSMLVGTTFAWFTDSVTSGNNKIIAGNLDIELYYANTPDGTYKSVVGEGDIFVAPTDATKGLWEPGHTEVAYLKIVNEGTLALKYQLQVNPFTEVTGTSVNGNEIKLSEILEFVATEPSKTAPTAYTRETAQAAALAGDGTALTEYTTKVITMAPGEAQYIALVVYMPEEVGNEANYLTDTTAPSIEFALNLQATQVEAENDSFGPDYDAQAPELTYEVTPANIQEYLDGQHVDLTNAVLQLTAGDYGVLYLGRPTKYAANDTVYTCETHDFSTEDATVFQAHMAESGYHTTPRYATTLENLTIRGTEGATVAGVLATSGHAYGDVTDFVLDKDYDVGSAYYNTLTMKNISFRDVNFTGKVDLGTSDADTIMDGVTFDECSFTTGGTASSNSCAVRFYNEANNGKSRNITVKNSTFTNCYQGVYVHHVSGVTIIGNTFDTTGHNAIAMQNHSGAIDLKNVVISNNIFKNIGDRVIRFGDVGADSNITLEYNYATGSGDEDGEVMKATTIAAGTKVTANYNDWNGTVVNPELQDGKTAKLAVDDDTLVAALENNEDVVLVDDVKIDPAGMSNAYGTTGINVKNGQTIDGNGHVLDIQGAGGTWDSGISTTGGLIKNITITGSFRGIFVNHNSDHSEKVVLENVTIDGTVYTISCDQGINQGLEATNSVFKGWTSYAATLGNAKFTNCSFGEGSGYAYCRPYAPTEFVGCDFEAGFEMDARAAVTFVNCTIGGVPLTAENLSTLVTSNTANASVK